MRGLLCRLLNAFVVTLVPGALLAQTIAPRPSHSFVVSGYGTAGWFKTQGQPNGFFTSFSPILLFRITDKVFAEGELEFELEEGATQTGLEYATVHYLANDNVTFSAGKFLLPFGVFGQRIHPTWINRFASMPPIYGHAGGISGADPLAPILSDVGIMASAVVPLGDLGRNLTFSGYLTNGPQAEVAGHDEAEALIGMAALRGEGEEGHVPEFAFGESSTDNNSNKMLGGRVGLVLAPDLEIDVSALWAQWGEAEVGVNVGRSLSYSGYNIAAEYRPRNDLELRTEWVWLRTDVEEVEESASVIETVPRFGGYVQASYRTGPWQPVVRYSLVDQNQDEDDDHLAQYGLGLNYWFSPSVAIMASYEVNRDKFDDGADLPNDRFLIHWAFGF